VPQDYSYVINPYREPIVRVKPGERVTIYTDDAFESRITKKDDLPSRALATAKFLNPQTGPIYVEGTKPGDTLAVRIEGIEPKRDFAVSVLMSYFGGLTSTNFTRTLQ
jgi:acetamidase/formamidase